MDCQIHGIFSGAFALMKSLQTTWQELDIRTTATQMLKDIGHPYGKGEMVYDVTFENVQAGLRTDYLFPARQPSWRPRYRHRRSLRARAGLVHLWRRRSDGALQCQCRRAEDADPASDPLGDRLEAVQRGVNRNAWRRSCRPKSRPSWFRRSPARSRKARKPRSVPTNSRISTCTTRCGSACGRPRSPSWRCRRGRTSPGRMAAGIPERPAQGLRSHRNPPLARGVPAPLLRLQPVQALGDAERAEGFGRRLAVAARRLARAVGFERSGMA